MLIVYDSIGFRWTFNEDQSRLYSLEAEKHVPFDEKWPYENGYPCYSWAEAVIMLNNMGYMGDEYMEDE